MTIFAAILILAFLALGYVGAPFAAWAVFVVVTLFYADVWLIVWPIAIVALVILGSKSARSKVLTAPLMNFLVKSGAVPQVSKTEEIALRAGTNWIETDLFNGKPDFKKVFAEPYPTLTKAEKAFLEGQAEELCAMTSDWEIFQKRDLTKKTWEFMKKEKFFGMIIPKQYGGLGFSALGHSAVVAKLATRSQVLAISTMVPNSLGPAELLMRYGTEKQKDYYLPRLADGRDLPCFALTEPEAGSDAASITSGGEVFKDKDGKIKIRLNFEKRYITLGAVATVLGLAFVLRDPKNLLGKGVKPGITCALIPHDLPGVKLGRRHDPMGVPFVNSPVSGKDVVVDVDAVIGGEAGVGEGWLMLMECLAVGRGISLPSTSAGGAKMVARVVSNYASIRTQFGMSIGKFEAIEEPIARIVGYTYMIEAMRKFVAGAVDGGAKPAVTNAIAKYHSTEKFRTIINDGMDILGGAAIIRGPRNLLSHAYYGTPVGITVEGANIMTRGLIQFGQGAVRCHKYSYNEMKALQENDLVRFDENFWAHAGHFISNKIRSFVLTITRGYVHIPRKGGVLGRYEQKLAWASARFAFMSDAALALYGASVKRRETINGRFGDALSYMLMATCIIKRFEAEGEKEEDKACVDWALRYCMAQTNEAFISLYDNMSPIFRIHAFAARVNPICRMPSDKMGQKLVNALLENGKFRDNLTQEIYLPKDEKEIMARYEKGFEFIHSTKDIARKIRSAVKAGELPKGKVNALVGAAKEAKVITEAEAETMAEAVALWHDCIMVDSWEIDDYISYAMKKSV